MLPMMSSFCKRSIDHIFRPVQTHLLKTPYADKVHEKDQWKKKKQTKKEAAAARRGKLDPDSELNRNAKEVMDERAQNKRKLRKEEEGESKLEEETDEDENDDDEDSFVPMDGVVAEEPGQGLKKAAEKSNKKPKFDSEPEQDDEESGVEVDDEEVPVVEKTALSKKEQKRAAKREREAQEKTTTAEDAAEEQPTPKAKSAKEQKTEDTPKNKKSKSKRELKAAATAAALDEDEAMPDASEASGFAENLDISGLDGKDDSEGVSEPLSPTFDAAEAASATTSVSSTIPTSEKPKHIVIPKDTSALKARLAAKIEALRAARKADGPDGKPVRTRQELIEARREKQVQRKEHKKELRRLAKLEEERKREEALASNSPGMMSPAVERDEGSFSFGRVAFTDGTQMSHDLSYVLNQGKRKGPSDAKTALIKVQNQKKRLENMDEETRAGIAEKEAWLTARRRVEGEKIRNDEAILKKTIKRTEANKKKSEKAWTDRLTGVNRAMRDRVKKRDDNLRKRRDEKLLGKSGKKKKGAAGGGKKKGGRPGFEGSFGVGGKKK